VSSPIPGHGVRPTKRALEDLGLPLPDLGQILESLTHELLVKAQRIPDELAAGGAHRITSLDDRVWFKAKTEDWRGVATDHGIYLADVPAEPDEHFGRWWLGAAGHRNGDSPQRDFYERLTASCKQARADYNTANNPALKTDVSTAHLLPVQWDSDRLDAELAVQARVALQRVICEMAAQSLRTGHTMTFELNGWCIHVLIRADDGEAYIVIGAEGQPNATAYALLLSSIPGIDKDDWQPEPGGVAGLTPASGEIIWSAIIPTEASALLLDTYPAKDL
jgi:hypothetical protein